jgi:hypothetical protein
VISWSLYRLDPCFADNHSSPTAMATTKYEAICSNNLRECGRSVHRASLRERDSVDMDVYKRSSMWNERVVCALGCLEVEGSMNHHHDMFKTSEAIIGIE